ncbi:MAG: hypothetical protein AAFQ27_00020 [Pseudomonadota bacterium]
MVQSLLAFSRFELELFFKTFIAVFFTFLAPNMIYGSAIVSGGSEAAAFYLPLMIGLIMVFVATFTLATQVVTYREAGFYKRILVTQISPVGIALSNAIRGFVLVVIGLSLLSALAVAMTGALPQVNYLQGLIAIPVAAGAVFLFGLIPACFVNRSASMFALASVLSYVLVFFSDARPDMGPWLDWAEYVDVFSPSYHALRVLVAGFEGTLFTPDALINVVGSLIWAGISLLVIRRFLSWM